MNTLSTNTINSQYTIAVSSLTADIFGSLYQILPTTAYISTLAVDSVVTASNSMTAATASIDALTAATFVSSGSLYSYSTLATTLRTDQLSSGTAYAATASISTASIGFVSTGIARAATASIENVSTVSMSTGTILTNLTTSALAYGSSISTTVATGGIADISFLRTSAISTGNLVVNAVIVPSISTNNLAVIIDDIQLANAGAGFFDTLSTGLFTVQSATVESMTTSNISSETLYADQLNATNINTDTLSTQTAVIGLLSQSTLTTNQIAVSSLYARTADVNTATVANLSTGAVQVNAVSFDIASANLADTTSLLAATGLVSSVQVTDLLTANMLYANYISAGSIDARIISTYSITVWGPNTLTNTGSTILQGSTRMTDTVYGSSINATTTTASGTYIAAAATISSIVTEKLTGSTIQTTTTFAPSLSTTTLSTGTVTVASAVISSLQSVYVSTAALYTIDISVSTFTVNTIDTGSFLDRVENLSTQNIITSTATIDVLSTNTLSTTTFITVSGAFDTLSAITVAATEFTVADLTANRISTNSVSTGSIVGGSLTAFVTAADAVSTNLFTFTTLSLSGEQRATNVSTGAVWGTNLTTRNTSTNSVSTNSITGTTLLISTLGTDFLSTGTLRAQSTLGGFTSLSTNQISTLNFMASNATIRSLSTVSISTATLVANMVQVNTVSTNILSTGIVYASQVWASTLNANTVTASTMGARQGLFSTMNVNTLSTGVLTISTTSLLFNTVSTGILSAGTLLFSSVNTRGMSTTTVSTGIWRGGPATIPGVLMSNISTTVNTTFNDARTVGLSTSILSTNVLNASTLFSFFSTISTNRLTMGTAAFLTAQTATVDALSTNALSTVRFFADNFKVARTVASTISSGLITTNSTITAFLSTGQMDIQFLSTRAVFVSSINDAPFGTTNTATNFTATGLVVSKFIAAQSSIAQEVYVSSAGTGLAVTGMSVVNMPIAPSRWVISFNDRLDNNRNITNLYSDDGITWNTITTNTQFGTSSYVYNGRYWTAFGSLVASTISRSIDGITWFNSNSSFVPASLKQGGIWNGNYWIVIANTIQAKLYYTYDQYRYFPLTGTATISSPQFITWNGNMYILTNNLSGFVNTLLYSYDANTWYYRKSGGFNSVPNTVIWIGDKWVAGGLKDGLTISCIQYSYDGMNWSNSGPSFLNYNQDDVWSATCWSMAWNGKMVVAVGTGRDSPAYTIQYSYDGLTWSPCASGGFNHTVALNDKGIYVSWNGNQWIASGLTSATTSQIQYSYDGINWSVSADISVNGTGPIGNNLNTYPTLQANNLCIFANNQITNVSPFAYANQTIITTASTISFNSTIFFNRSSFRVGIQESEPQYDLHVRGDIETTTGAVKPSGGTWTDFVSDRRLKTNIQLANVDMCYSTVKAIDLYKYKFINGYSTDPDTPVLGFIAQNVQTHFPKAVHIVKDRTYDDLLYLNTTQVTMSHYGATQKLGQHIESNDAQLSSSTYPLQATKDSIQGITRNLEIQSTAFITLHSEAVSTLTGTQLELQSLADTYDSLVSQLSSLLI